MYIIYKHTSPSGKSYIGLTSGTLEQRLKSHIIASNNGSNGRFHQAIRKYGIENFTSEIIVENVPDYMVNAFEMYWINHYDTYNNGYNMTIGGSGTMCYRHTQETREKMSISHTGKIVSQETRDKIGDWHRGKFVSDETREKIRQDKIGRTYSDEVNKKKACPGEKNGMYGVTREKFECPHCKKFFDIANLKRWHLDNCKSL